MDKKKTLNLKLIDNFEDEESRFLLVNTEVNDNILTIVNLYAPNNPHTRNNFFKNIKL